MTLKQIWDKHQSLYFAAKKYEDKGAKAMQSAGYKRARKKYEAHKAANKVTIELLTEQYIDAASRRVTADFIRIGGLFNGPRGEGC